VEGTPTVSWRRHRLRFGRAGRPAAFQVRGHLLDGREIVATAYMRGVTTDGTALYEAEFSGISRDEWAGMTASLSPAHSLLRVRFVPDVIDLR
jgi:hypothetical protein